jgi:hypothetical protein
MDIPPFPSRIGNHGTAIDQRTGRSVRFTIVDEIACTSTTRPDKVVCLQQFSFEDRPGTELRLGCYIYTGAKWGWGRFAPMISFEDLRTIVREAVNKGWITDEDLRPQSQE